MAIIIDTVGALEFHLQGLDNYSCTIRLNEVSQREFTLHSPRQKVSIRVRRLYTLFELERRRVRSKSKTLANERNSRFLNRSTFSDMGVFGLLDALIISLVWGQFLLAQNARLQILILGYHFGSIRMPLLLIVECVTQFTLFRYLSAFWR